RAARLSRRSHRRALHDGQGPGHGVATAGGRRKLCADDHGSNEVMLIKICGITRLDDAEAAVALGAGALGFIFWPGSPRFIDPYRARAIVAALPSFVTAVGVFVNQPAAHVNGVASLVRLGAIQLHGDET